MSFLASPQQILAQEEARQASMIESLEPSKAIISRTHFVEWFDGDVLDSVWEQNNIIGVGTYGMVDAVGEGFRLAVDAINPQLSSITAGKSLQHFDPTSSIMESVQRRQSAQGTVQWGLGNRTDGDLGNTLDESATFQEVSTLTFVRISTINTLSQTTIDTSLPVNTDFHHTILDLSATNVKGFIDGILEGTITTDLPDASSPLYPGFKISTFAVAVAQGRIKFMEVFNK